MKPKSTRAKFATRTFRIISTAVRDRAIAALQNAPVDELRPLEVVIREEVRKRKLDQNAALWAGPLRDISEQAWLEGKQFTAEVWAHYFKVQLLPEVFDPELCLEDYCKWQIGPAGDRVLTGSTTQLTQKGHAEYREQIEAFGASMGVNFSAPPAL